MRKLTIALACLLAVATLTTGCGLLGDDHRSKKEEIERIIDEEAQFTVFLRQDVTARQRTDIETRLRAVPGLTKLGYVSEDEAYQRFRKLYSPEPATRDFLEELEPGNLPESFEAKMTDAEAVRAVRDSATGKELEKLPGVQQIVYRCTTIDECRKQRSRPPTASPS